MKAMKKKGRRMRIGAKMEKIIIAAIIHAAFVGAVKNRFVFKRGIKAGNKTGLITYPDNDRGVLLKSRMRGNLKSGSVRGAIAASGRRWL